MHILSIYSATWLCAKVDFSGNEFRVQFVDVTSWIRALFRKLRTIHEIT